ncbi:MAG: F0F1 ATP synthase subunit delta [bacterium]|nr:F0F1 ATP synthase subunit delta [bacterium]
MNSEELAAKLLAQLNTQEDLINLVDELEALSRRVFQAGKLKEEVRTKFSPRLEEVFVVLRQEQARLSSSEDQERFFRELVNSLLKVKIAKIVFAFTPSQEFLEKIKTLLEQRTKEKIVLDISIQEELIGGIQIEYNGLYRDYSVSTALENFFNDKTQVNTLIQKGRL